MTQQLKLPEYVHQIDGDEKFHFACHKSVPCFTECCRMLELSLTPYDALRLRHGTGKTSKELLDNYIIVEQEPGEPFPRLYLTMVDDGRASCVFVSPKGCTIYPHRPSACRTYPLGRAVMRQSDNALKEHFVLMKEPHCKGFNEPVEKTVQSYSEEQELNTYMSFNDQLSLILQHEAVRKGFIPSKKQVDYFILALYDLDTFRTMILSDQLAAEELPGKFKKSLADNDEDLLRFGIKWLHSQLFSGISPASRQPKSLIK